MKKANLPTQPPSPKDQFLPCWHIFEAVFDCINPHFDLPASAAAVTTSEDVTVGVVERVKVKYTVAGWRLKQLLTNSTSEFIICLLAVLSFVFRIVLFVCMCSRLMMFYDQSSQSFWSDFVVECEAFAVKPCRQTLPISI